MDPEACKCQAARTPLQVLDNFKVSYGSSGYSGVDSWASTKDQFLPSRKGKYPFLDLTRICCVWCVAVDHGNWTFGRWNCMFTQDWVLQYLFLVCGVSYGISNGSLGGYLRRLSAYFVFGVLLNWIAAMIAGWNWKSNMFDVVFHLWFVVGVMIYATMLAPMKWYLKSVTEENEGEVAPEEHRPAAEAEESARRPSGSENWAQERDLNLRTVLVIGSGIVCIMIFFIVIMRPVVWLLAQGAGSRMRTMGQGADFWGFPQDVEEAKVFFARLFMYCMCSVTNIYLVLICPQLLKHKSTTTWLVILNTYVHKLFFFRGQDDRFFHGLDLMIMGVSCYYLGLRHRRLLGMYIVRYWFLVLLVCALIWPPGANQRFDETAPEPNEKELRLRVYLLEAIFVVMWLAAGERLVQPEIFSEDGLSFLNNWGLLVFLVHKAVHMTIMPPLNWAVLLLLAPACWCVEKAQR